MIRYATIDEAKFIYDLSKENLSTSFKQKTIEQYIEQKETFHIFVSKKEELTGYMIVWISDIYSEIVDIVIKEKFRRKGYAKKLLEFAFRFVSKKVVKQLSLEVSHHNEGAIKLYKELGFKKEKVIRNYYKESDAFLLVKKYNINKKREIISCLDFRRTIK